MILNTLREQWQTSNFRVFTWSRDFEMCWTVNSRNGNISTHPTILQTLQHPLNHLAILSLGSTHQPVYFFLSINPLFVLYLFICLFFFYLLEFSLPFHSSVHHGSNYPIWIYSLNYLSSITPVVQLTTLIFIYLVINLSIHSDEGNWAWKSPRNCNSEVFEVAWQNK